MIFRYSMNFSYILLNYVKCGSDVDFIEGHGRESWNFHPVATKDIQRIPKNSKDHIETL